MTGDPAEIERVLQKVNGLVDHVETVRFDPYNHLYRHDWKNVMAWFQREVEVIEQEATRWVFDISKREREGERERE